MNTILYVGFGTALVAQSIVELGAAIESQINEPSIRLRSRDAIPLIGIGTTSYRVFNSDTDSNRALKLFQYAAAEAALNGAYLMAANEICKTLF